MPTPWFEAEAMQPPPSQPHTACVACACWAPPDGPQQHAEDNDPDVQNQAAQQLRARLARAVLPREEADGVEVHDAGGAGGGVGDRLKLVNRVGLHVPGIQVGCRAGGGRGGGVQGGGGEKGRYITILPGAIFIIVVTYYRRLGQKDGAAQLEL